MPVHPSLDDGRPVAAIAHRGGAGHPDLLGLENTLAAFEHAAALGYRYLETDVRLSADGELVALHDAVLDRVTDQQGAVADLPLANVVQARVGGREPVPSLADLVEALPQVRWNLDLKAPGTAQALARFVSKRGLEARVVVGSFSTARLCRFRRATRGAVATSASPPEAAAFVATGRRVGGWQALQVPPRFGLLDVVTPRLLRHAHRRGVAVHVWTIDETDEMGRLVDLGVDGIMTDRTDRLRSVLMARHQW